MKITKKEISTTLRSQDVTAIFSMAARMGIDVDNRNNVYKFIKENAPSNNVYNGAYRLSHGAGDFKNFRCYRGGFENHFKRMPLTEAIKFAKMQKKNGWMSTNYGKVLVEGNSNIYWVHPSYKHSDYNKSIAFENTPENRRVAIIINKYLTKTQ